MEFRYSYERPLVLANKVVDYKAREELFSRALRIAEALRGDKLLENEYAALFYGTMIYNKDEADINLNTDWELVAEAGRAAADGHDVVDGEVVQVRKGLRRRSNVIDMPPE